MTQGGQPVKDREALSNKHSDGQDGASFVFRRQQIKNKRNRNSSAAGRAVFIVLGILFVGLGALGAFLPVLPTTPFLLVAAFCFARGSEKLNARFKSTWLYRNHLETMDRGEGMTVPAKIRIMIAVTLVMGIAAFFMLRAYWITGSVGALCGAVTMAAVWLAHLIVFCFVVKTCPENRTNNIPRDIRREKTDRRGNGI